MPFLLKTTSRCLYFSTAVLIYIVYLLAVGGKNGVIAQEILIPYHVQAQYFKKIFTYSQTISNTANPSVAIVGTSNEVCAAVQSAFNKVGLTDADTYTPDAFFSATKPHEVLYVCADTELDALSKLSASRKMLSITGSGILFETGKIGIGLKLKDNKCQIYLNTERIKKESQRFSAAFLNLSKSR